MAKRSGWIGIGRQATTGPAVPVVRFYPLIPTGSDACEFCSAIRPLDQLESFAYDDDGEPYMRCVGGCDTGRAR